MQLGIEEPFMNGSEYWNGLKKKVNDVNDHLSEFMTKDVLNQIKENSTAHEVPFGQITDEEMNAGVSSTYHKAYLNFDGTYSGSRGFASQGRVSGKKGQSKVI